MDKYDTLYQFLLLGLAIIVIIAVIYFYRKVVKKTNEGKMVVFANNWDFALTIVSCISLVVYWLWDDEDMMVKYSILAFSVSCFATSIVWSFLVNLSIKYGVYSALVKFLTIILIIHIILLMGNYGMKPETTKKVTKNGKTKIVPLTKAEQREAIQKWEKQKEGFRQSIIENKALLLSIIGGTLLFKAALERHNANQEKTKQMIENGKTKKLVFTFLTTFLLVFGYSYPNAIPVQDETSVGEITPKTEIHAQSEYQLSSDELVSEKQLNTESTYVKDETFVKDETPKTEIHAQSDYQLSSDGLVLEKWLNTESTYVDMAGDVVLSKITKIGEDAFQGLENLETIKFSDKLKYIGEDAFDNCIKLTAVTIPENVTLIGGGAFDVCHNLKTIIFKGNRTELEHDVFHRSLLEAIYVPAESIEWYKTSEYLKYYDEEGIIKPIK
ncbi:hypothetical protein CAPN008_07380 [Capnocytophaga canis]|uniref:leucine-rich repeat domain-containing protein n=1 Tax=Capnocytophaga canis TaxID=1848903 RepID=UPI001AC262A7|nr:leucine-rich repeat domain-containing protein [Capnocytophaga canis]GIM60688.1 hypothetical protein CAPN008_07380 [Capnocytophaga canis]